MTILILGGTREARALAAALVELGQDVISSLAGRVSNPALPVGAVRVGGFGGVAGLTTYLHENDIDRVIDATHPFAAQITANAAVACVGASVPLLRLQRPSWRSSPLSNTWHWVQNTREAASQLGVLGERPFISSGRQTLPDYLDWRGFALVRVVEPLTFSVPATWQVWLARGPFDLDSERQLLRDHRIDVLTTKDSGGPLTEAKLHAAAELGMPVVVIDRPPLPDGVPVVEEVGAAVAWATA